MLVHNNHGLCTVLAATGAGGHVECVQLLIAVGCRTALTNDVGPQQSHSSCSCHLLRRTIVAAVFVPLLAFAVTLD